MVEMKTLNHLITFVPKLPRSIVLLWPVKIQRVLLLQPFYNFALSQVQICPGHGVFSALLARCHFPVTVLVSRARE